MTDHTGRVVFTPQRDHTCAPGWTTGGPAPIGGNYAHPPDARLYPKGTVWECACSKTWVSTGPISHSAPGIVDFRPERRRERKRRERLTTTQAVAELDPPDADKVDWARMETIPLDDRATLSTRFNLSNFDLLGMRTSTVNDLLAIAKRRKLATAPPQRVAPLA